MNRFTQLTPAQFNPMSWEEIASVPMAKRQQHDSQQQAMAEMESTLAQIQALKKHEPQAKLIQDSYRNKVENLSNRLASEGVNDDLKNEILRLNSQYKSDLSPQGNLGKIQGAYTKRQENDQEFLKSIDKRHSMDIARNQLNEHNEQYAGYDDDGNIIMPEATGMIQYHDVPKYIEDRLSSINKQFTDIIGNNIEVANIDGVIGLYDKTTQNRVETNNPQLQSAINQLKNDLTNENTELGKFTKMYGYDENLDQMLLDAAGKYSINNNTTKNVGRFNPLTNPYDSSGKTVPEANQPNIYSGYGDDTSFFGTNPTESSVKNNIEQLKNSNSPEEQRLGKIKEVRYDRIKNDYNKSLINKEDGFNHYAATIKTFNDEIDYFKDNHQSEELSEGLIDNVKNYDGEEILKALAGDDNYQIRSASQHYKFETSAYNRDIGNSKVLLKNGEVIGTNISKKAIENAEKILPEYKKYYEGLNKSLASDRHNTHKFVMTGLSSGDNKRIEADAHKLMQAFGTNEFKFNRINVATNEGRKDIEDIENDDSHWFRDRKYDLKNPKDQSELMSLLQNADPSNLTWVSTSSNNENGLPSVELALKMPKESESASKLEDSTIYFNLELNKNSLTNPTTGQVTTGVRPGSAFIIDQLEKYGDNEGKALAYTMRNRIEYKDIIPKFREDYSQSDNIKKYVNPDNIKFDLNDVSFDIDMNSETGEYSILKSNIHEDSENYVSDTLGWDDILGLTNSDKTQESLQSLSPAFTIKLVEDIKNVVGVNDINQMTDTQADKAIKYLAKINAPLVSNSHYDLLNLLKSR